jgi:hypothetical protein
MISKDLIPKEKKELLAFIRNRYPVGSEVWDQTRSGPFIVRKNSIFAVYELDYAERPEKETDVIVEFLVRSPGKYSDFFSVCSMPKGWILQDLLHAMQEDLTSLI